MLRVNDEFTEFAEPNATTNQFDTFYNNIKMTVIILIRPIIEVF